MITKYTPRGTARDRILTVASELFYREGIRAVGIDTIIAASGIAKMTFYNHFKSKDELVYHYVRQRSMGWMEWLERKIERFAHTLAERPLAVFDALEERFGMADYRGCAFINTLIEMANREHLASQAAIEHKEHVQASLQAVLHTSGYQESEALAAQFMILIDGAIVTALREGTPQAARTAKQIAVQLLAASPR